MAHLRYLWKMIFDGRGVPDAAPFSPQPETWSNSRISGSCLGHSTVLLNFLGTIILTDPVFSQRIGPGFHPFILGPKRYLQPALDRTQTPTPDIIVLSHAHFDHLDLPSLKSFSRETPVVTARSTSDLLIRRGFRNVTELGWGESAWIPPLSGGKPVRFTGLEVAHWGARMVRDEHRGYSAYLMERDGFSVCFAGDTAYTTAFSQLRSLKRPLDLMLMPIGAYDPWIRAHCNPEQAAAMARQAHARSFVPIHQQTFKLSSEPLHEPAQRIRSAWADCPERLQAVDVGATFHVPLA
ncbi:MAG: MBL fold metallo-hydrolase [Opitutaceae bacterium]|nr:MBL fold metallo-hydrolase [Opitutaceae bacterium]